MNLENLTLGIWGDAGVSACDHGGISYISNGEKRILRISGEVYLRIPSPEETRYLMTEGQLVFERGWPSLLFLSGPPPAGRGSLTLNLPVLFQ